MQLIVSVELDLHEHSLKSVHSLFLPYVGVDYFLCLEMFIIQIIIEIKDYKTAVILKCCQTGEPFNFCY